jgi:plasmid stabilization system protein ParE
VSYDVRWSRQAELDLDRLFDFMLDRELNGDNGDNGDPETAVRAIDAIRKSIEFLRHSPFSCRRAGPSAFMRELIIPFGNSGYVALFEVVDARTLIVAALRHQREQDYSD